MGTTSGSQWEHLSDQDLLGVRICDLGLRLEESDLPERIAALHGELEARDLKLLPVCYLADEWFTPDRHTNIGIPFFLAHPRLKSLEFRMMLSVEGGTRSSCMRLLRHETGHALDHAYGLHRTSEWQRAFGSPRVRYTPELYAADPRSRAYVRNLPEDYAQCHPEEDFAETFAVWLNPASDWKERYEGWPAMRKLRYVDRTMRALRRRRPRATRAFFQSDARRLRSTLGNYYERKFRMYHLDDLAFAAPVLRSIFRTSKAPVDRDRASRLLSTSKRALVESIARFPGERPGRVATVVSALSSLADKLGLVVGRDRERALVEVSTFVAALVSNRLLTHTYRSRHR